MEKVLSSLRSAYDIMYTSGYVLEPQAVENLRKELTRMGQNYQLLAVRAFDNQQMRWKCTPKLYYVAAHLADEASLVNPKCVQSYSIESMVGVVCSMYAKSQSGPWQQQIQKVVMMKYRAGLQLLRN